MRVDGPSLAAGCLKHRFDIPVFFFNNKSGVKINVWSGFCNAVRAL